MSVSPVITEQPGGTPDIELKKSNTNNDQSSVHPDQTNTGKEDYDNSSLGSSQISGYERESNECTEFCIDFVGCFGMFDTCCPSTGEGFATNAGIFIANIAIKCVRC